MSALLTMQTVHCVIVESSLFTIAFISLFCSEILENKFIDQAPSEKCIEANR